MSAYLQSASGRTLVLAWGVVLMGFGLCSLLGATRAAAAIAIAALGGGLAVGGLGVGLGAGRYPKRSLLVAMLGPIVLGLAFVTVGIEHAVKPLVGHVMLSLGVVAVAAFAGLSLKARPEGRNRS